MGKVQQVHFMSERWKLETGLTMNLYPWVEMVVFSELGLSGHVLHHFSKELVQDFLS